MEVNIQSEKRLSRIPKITSVFAAVVVTAVASSALTSFIFLSAYTPPSSSSAPLSFDSGKGSVSSHESTIEAVVQKSTSSVVSIVATRDLPVFEQQLRSPFGNDDPLNQLFGPFQFRVPQYQQKGTEKREVAGGTGFIVSSEGTILTNRHVVDVEGADFTVIFPDGRRLPATIQAKDPVQDLAIVKVKEENLPTLPLGDSDQVRLGQSVIAIGNTLGEFQNSVSAGIVSGLARKLVAGNQQGDSELIEGAIQTDAAINPGNSGGPLLNLRGEVVGINTAIVIGSQNVGFAIPINKAKKVLADVQRTGKISYAYLGARYILVDAEIQKARGLSVDSGALIIGSNDGREPGVVPKSPAAKVGLREGDVILSVSGTKINADHSLSSLIQQYRVGETVVLRVLSGGEEKDVKVTLEERP